MSRSVPAPDPERSLDAAGLRFALVAARFNGEIVDSLLAGAMDCLLEHGAGRDDLTILRVSGAWELAVVVEELAHAGRHHALVALGAVIRGETPHFEYICSEASRALGATACRYRLPVGFGVLTCDDADQARARAGGAAGNKGREAALAALDTADLLRRLRETGAA